MLASRDCPAISFGDGSAAIVSLVEKVMWTAM
jgi:hypothetical protein